MEGDWAEEIVEEEEEPSEEKKDEEIGSKDDEDEEEEASTAKVVEEKPENVHNSWAGKFKVNEFHEDKPVILDSFLKVFEERKRVQRECGLLNGWEDCDVAECFCKEETQVPGKTQIRQSFKEILYKNIQFTINFISY